MIRAIANGILILSLTSGTVHGSGYPISYKDWKAPPPQPQSVARINGHTYLRFRTTGGLEHLEISEHILKREGLKSGEIVPLRRAIELYTEEYDAR